MFYLCVWQTKIICIHLAEGSTKALKETLGALQSMPYNNSIQLKEAASFGMIERCICWGTRQLPLLQAMKLDEVEYVMSHCLFDEVIAVVQSIMYTTNRCSCIVLGGNNGQGTSQFH